jgi:hypothetical protein
MRDPPSPSPSRADSPRIARELCLKHQYELDLRGHDDLISWAREASGLLHRRQADTLIVPTRRGAKRRGQ